MTTVISQFLYAHPIMNLLFFGIFLIYLTLKSNCVINNVCATYDDYYTFRDNPNCWYNVAAEANATQIIQYYGYPLEVYKVTTPDGYIISVYRIPNSNATGTKGPVFLQHGLYSTSANFLGREKDSLAFLLSDAGYDVWLGNYRGTEYSEEHVNLTVFDKKYWDYSVDEIGLYDIPTMLKLIVQKTEQNGNIVYIGHSLGTTIALMYGSSMPQQAKDTVKLFILLAPAAKLSNMISPLRFAAPFADKIQNFINHNDMIRLVSQAKPQRQVTKLYCLESPILMRYCIDTLNLFYGPYNQMGPDMLPVFFNQFPAGTSLKVVKQCADFIRYPFRRYNYGPENINKYGSALPPKYDVSKIEVPIFVMYAVNDWVCTKEDALILYRNLSPKAKIYGIHEVNVSNFNHIDFLFGKDVKSIVYDKILKLLDHVS